MALLCCCALKYLLCERGGQHTDPPTTKIGSTCERCTNFIKTDRAKDISFPFTESIFSLFIHPSIYPFRQIQVQIVSSSSGGSRLLGTRVNRTIGRHTHTHHSSPSIKWQPQLERWGRVSKPVPQRKTGIFLLSSSYKSAWIRVSHLVSGALLDDSIIEFKLTSFSFGVVSSLK